MNIGANIRSIREERGLLQVELAERVHISPAMLCQIERGTKVPTLPLSVDIARELGCPLDRLIQDTA